MPQINNNNNNNVNNKMIYELAKDYSAYMKVDLPNQTLKIHDTIEEMMIRLEEFESIVGMVQNLRAECTFEHLVRFRSVNPQLLELCKRIDALEHVVARANIDLTNLEAAVDTAEIELGVSTTVSDRLLGIFNPLSLFKYKSDSSALVTTPRTDATIDLPPIFRTKDAFESQQKQ
ncbi:biogenesis of lysosome-related organelles complex 1 subunit 4-like [Microplitis mediator]|uniref:biogenesis of lysosome-related organelles complex 1 subunit 4-like n=1 Tax=Microplitis mediator TaxID=375433 RepID=UPI0025526C4A|nr:biogenesis of lysosome-related organelles complex 1 subunit 4-like [Microplitis mediator]